MPREPRIYLPAQDGPRDRAVIEGAAAHRVVHVLRLRAGNTLRVFDGAGSERRATVRSTAGSGVELDLLEHVEPLPEPPVPIRLACAFPRGQRGDWIVEKATELGVREIVPLPSSRAVLDPGHGRIDRWRRIAVEAAEQCGRAVVPALLQAPAPPSVGGGISLLADPLASRPIAAALRGAAPPAVTISVGPEGGWSDEERERLRADGAVAVSLGPRLLRVETAAVAALVQVLEATGGLATPETVRAGTRGVRE